MQRRHYRWFTRITLTLFTLTNGWIAAHLWLISDPSLFSTRLTLAQIAYTLASLGLAALSGLAWLRPDQALGQRLLAWMQWGRYGWFGLLLLAYAVMTYTPPFYAVVPFWPALASVLIAAALMIGLELEESDPALLPDWLRGIEARGQALIEGLDGWPRWPLWIALTAGPALLTLALLTLWLRVDPRDYIANVWDDETEYWETIEAFVAVGFEAGNFSYSEIDTPTWTPYNIHGPVYVVFYGLLGKLFGWGPLSPLLINLALVSLSLLAFALLADLKPRDLLLLIALTLSYSALVLYLPIASQESMHHSIALLLAGGMAYLRRGTEQGRLPVLIMMALALLLGSFTRMNWAFVLLPVLLAALPRRTWTGTAISGALTVGLVLLAMRFNAATTTLAGNPITWIMSSMSESLAALGAIVAEQWRLFRIQMLIERPYYPDLSYQGFQMLALAVFMGAAIIRSRSGRATQDQRELWFDALLILFIALYMAPLNFFVGVVYMYYRVTAIPLLMAALLLIARGQRAPAILIVILSLLGSWSLRDNYLAWADNYIRDEPMVAESRATLDGLVFYDEDTDNRWCNTVGIDWLDRDYRLSTMEPGVGHLVIINYALSIEMPLKARYYLLAEDSHAALIEMGAHLLDAGAPPLADGRIYTVMLESEEQPLRVYYNLDADCPPLWEP